METTLFSVINPVFWGSRDNSGILGDLDFSLLRNPVLSASQILGWKGKGAHISRENQDTAIISYADGADTAWIYKIDKKRGLVVGLDLYNKKRDTILLNGTYFYRDANTMYVLEKIALRGDTSLSKGGLRFSKVHVNDSIPDSLFVAANAVLWAPARPVDRIIFEKRRSGIKISFRSDARIERISIIDATGKVRFLQDRLSNTYEFFWSGMTSSGTKAPDGMYVIKMLGKNLNFSRGFLWMGEN